jgi:transcriptional regulator with XRE-family HTH domain
MKPKDFPKELKRLREEKNLTQLQAARSMGKKTARSWAVYETGEQTPTLAQAEALLKAIGYALELHVSKR